MKQPIVTFPYSKKAWVEVLDFLDQKIKDEMQDPESIQNRLNKITLLAPVEFLVHYPGVKPYHFSYTESPDNFDYIIFDNKQKSCICKSFFAYVNRQFEISFKNQTFNVYQKQSSCTRYHGSLLSPAIFVRLSTLMGQFLYFSRNRSSKTINKIALVSANKLGNLGDDAVTWASYDTLKAVFPNAQIKIYRPPVFKWQIFQVDLLVLGGGGLFYDSCFDNAMNYTRYIAWAHEAKIPSCALGVGTQGIKTCLGKALYKNMLDLCEFISVRDKQDADILKYDVGVSTSIYVTQDMAFSLQRLPKKVPLLKQKHCDKPILLFSLIDTNAMRSATRMQNYRQTAATILKQWQHKFNIWCIIQSKSDIPLYSEYLPKEKLIYIPFHDIGQAIAVYQQADVILTSRFHGVVFSLLAQKPVLATGGKFGKVYRLIHNSLPSLKKNYIPITHFTAEKADKKISKMLKHPEKYTLSKDLLETCINTSFRNKDILETYRKRWESSNFSTTSIHDVR